MSNATKSRSDLVTVARQVLDLCAADIPWRPNRGMIQERFDLEYGQVKSVIRIAKRIAEQESGGASHSWWGFDPYPTAKEGYFRFCPSGDSTIAYRMKKYGFDMAADSIAEPLRITRLLLKNDYVTLEHAKSISRQLDGIRSQILVTSDLLPLAPVFREPKAA